nr:hypothetical protein [Massilia yuzhufengensis]
MDHWAQVAWREGQGRHRTGERFGRHRVLAVDVRHRIDIAHSRRWPLLFEAQVRRLFRPEVAEEFLVVARRIAASLQYGYVGRAEVA